MPNTYFDTAKIVGQVDKVEMSTVGSSNVTSDSVDLEGSLDDLGSNTDVDVSFEYREVGASTWNQTGTQTKSSTGSFTASVSGLASDTDHEFRARGDGNQTGETVTGSTLTFTTQTAAPVIDDFEDQDFSEYTGDTGSATIVSSPVANASYAAEMSGGDNEIRSTTGLNNYPSQGDIFRWNTYIDPDSIPRFYWGVQDSSNYYYLEYQAETGTLRFNKVDGGSETTLESKSVSFDTNVYSETEVEWRTNGRHLIELFDSGGTSLATIDATDDTFTSGGVGWGEFSYALVAKDSLIAYYKFNNGSGSTAFDFADSSEYGDSTQYDATINGASWSTVDTNTGGYSLDFDGTDDDVACPNLGLNSGESFTITAWFQPDTYPQTNNDIFSRYDGTDDILQVSERDAQDIVFKVGHAGGNQISFAAGDTGKPDMVHVAVTFDHTGPTGEIYLNGSSVGSQTATVDDFATTGGPSIGARSDGNNYYNGRIDDVRVYNRVLTATEISQIYTNND